MNRIVYFALVLLLSIPRSAVSADPVALARTQPLNDQEDLSIAMIERLVSFSSRKSSARPSAAPPIGSGIIPRPTLISGQSSPIANGSAARSAQSTNG